MGTDVVSAIPWLQTKVGEAQGCHHGLHVLKFGFTCKWIVTWHGVVHVPAFLWGSSIGVQSPGPGEAPRPLYQNRFMGWHTSCFIAYSSSGTPGAGVHKVPIQLQVVIETTPTCKLKTGFQLAGEVT